MKAEEFLILNNDSDFRLSKSGMYVSEMMIEFAKLHVQKALGEASNKVKLTEFAYEFLQEGALEAINKESILNSYNLNNIK